MNLKDTNAALQALVAKYAERIRLEVDKEVTFTVRRKPFLEEAQATVVLLTMHGGTSEGIGCALGYIQGIMWATGIINQDELREDIDKLKP